MQFFLFLLVGMERSEDDQMRVRTGNGLEPELTSSDNSRTTSPQPSLNANASASDAIPSDNAQWNDDSSSSSGKPQHPLPLPLPTHQLPGVVPPIFEDLARHGDQLDAKQGATAMVNLKRISERTIKKYTCKT